MSPKLPMLPGFTAVSDQVLVREALPEQPPADHPEAVVIYGWGDGLPKHVSKYAEGYRVLFPYSKQIIILSPISKAMFTSLDQRTEAMVPVLENLEKLLGDRKSSVLIHAMSNTGAISYGTTLKAFQDKNSSAFPHQLLVLDSTPGSPWLSRRTLGNWSRAMSLGTANWFPWPFAVTQALWAGVLLVNATYQWITGTEPAGAFALRVVDDESFETKEAKRLYLYSKEDDLISYEDIEAYVAESKERGYVVRTELFDGSGHVGHMRKHPEQYWKAIEDAWKWSNEEKTGA
ncbi:hypothetical protein NW754_001646 [Fusarium falciforme]|uniref:PaxU n=1 Tax=Fusarium falciforme TaxID=195108 RepID=A0A9W8RHB2_9HYPO|nr:hypothetical protein NW754_001646 [Fusarium falciforme]KAJ4195591.1 hypothetical protein NW755_001752 [Fusarium falciforme]